MKTKLLILVCFSALVARADQPETSQVETAAAIAAVDFDSLAQFNAGAASAYAQVAKFMRDYPNLTPDELAQQFDQSALLSKNLKEQFILKQIPAAVDFASGREDAYRKAAALLRAPASILASAK